MRIALCLLCLFSFSATVAGHDLIWEVVEEISGDVAIARAITLSENAAIFIGNVANTGNHVNDFVIQSLRRTNGSMKWTDRVPTGTTVFFGLQIASSQGRVFASGYLAEAEGETPSSSTDIAVRGYETLTGTLLWSDVWDAGRDDFPNALAAGPAAVVVVGYGGNTAAPGSDDPTDFMVRAYDPISGVVLWEDRVERSDFGTAAVTVAMTWNRVFVAGIVFHDQPQSADLLVRAYDAFSGELVWETMRLSTRPVSIEASGGRVFLAGYSAGAVHSYAGAFDARNGALLWEDHGTEPSNLQAIAVDGHRVAAAGASGSGLLVRVYDASSGIMEWQDQTFPAQLHSDLAVAVGLNERAVYVAGLSRADSPAPRYSEMLVRRYDAVAGTLSWDDRSHGSGSAVAVDLALGRNGLFVAGYESVFAHSKFVIRAYDVRNDGTVPQLERVSR